MQEKNAVLATSKPTTYFLMQKQYIYTPSNVSILDYGNKIQILRIVNIIFPSILTMICRMIQKMTKKIYGDRPFLKVM